MLSKATDASTLGSRIDYSPAITALKQSDGTLASVIVQIGLCTLDQVQLSGDLFAALCRSIIYQQLSGKAALAIHQRFLQLYPGMLSPEAVLNTLDETLRGVGISRTKVIYLKDLADKTLTCLPTLAELEMMSDAAIIQNLTQVKGIGCWTVQMLLIFRLHRWDVLPTDDLGIRKAIQRLYALPELPDKKTIAEIGQKWRPYCTIAAWYLWRSLELKNSLS